MSIATKRGDSGQTGLTGGDEELRTLTKDLQRELFKVGSAISTPLENKKPAPEIPLGDWAIPGEDPCSAAFDVSRTICRRAERLVVGLIESGLESWKQRREPWQVNVLAEAAVLASIADADHARRTVDFVHGEREWLARELGAQPSAANFLLIELDLPAPPLVARLEQQKILVRDCSGWPGVPFAHSIRVAVRTRAENLRLIAALRGVLCDS